MANPQRERGHTDIANEVMEALCKFRIPGELRQVVDVVIRKTWGWHKKEDWISNSQFVEMTGMRKGNVSRSLSKAITHCLVIKSDNGYRFNKNYNEWIPFDRIVIKKATKVIKSDNKLLSKVRDTKENKETIQKKVIATDAPASLSVPSESNGYALWNDKFQQRLGFRITKEPKKNENAVKYIIRDHGKDTLHQVLDYLGWLKTTKKGRDRPYWFQYTSSFIKIRGNWDNIMAAMTDDAFQQQKDQNQLSDFFNR